MPVPDAMKTRPQWVLWDWIERDGKPSKVPKQIDGTFASSTDPTTWSSYEEVTSHEADHAGIGFVFSPDDPIVGVDLDACWDPATRELAEWAREILALAGLSYAEFSPSGTGIKVFGTLPEGWGDIGRNRMSMDGPEIDGKAPGWERYDRGRFFTVTEKEGGTPRDQLEDLSRLMIHLSRLVTQRGTDHGEQEYESAGSEEKPERLEALLRLDPDLMARWSGITRGLKDESPSGIDQSIANHLAFHGMSGSEIEQSLRWRRRQLDLPSKHDGYFRHTVGKALAWAEEQRKKDHPMGEHPPAHEPSETPEDRSGGDEADRVGVTWKEIRDMDLKVDWLAEGILPTVGLSIITAKPKVGKSTLARDLAWAVASGDFFLGRGIKQAGDVLYVDADGNLTTIASHIEPLPEIEEALERIEVLHPKFVTVAEALPEAMEARDYALIILDTLQTVLQVRDLNDYAEAAGRFAELRTVSARKQTHICLIHHDRKAHADGGDTTLGSTALFGGVDTLIQMTRDEEDLRTVRSIQRDGHDMDSHEVTFEAGRVAIGETTAAAKALRAEDQKRQRFVELGQEIISLVAKSPGIAKSDAIKAIKGNQQRVREMISDLISEGHLREEPDPKDARRSLLFLPEVH